MRIATEEIRSLVVRAYSLGLATREQLAGIFSCHLSSIGRWIREARKTGRLAPLPKGHRPPAFSPAELDALKGFIDSNPGATLEEIRVHFKKGCSLAAMCKIVAKLGYTLKKNLTGERARQRRHPGEATRVGGHSKGGARGAVSVP
jgi:transposase